MITTPGYEHMRWWSRVVEIVPEERFVLRWHPHGGDPEKDYTSEPTTLVEFELEATTGGTRLTIRESGFDALPKALREESYRSNEEGWEVEIDNIAKHLES